jgi:fatty acid desaturase
MSPLLLRRICRTWDALGRPAMRAIASGSSCQSRPHESSRAASLTTAVTVVSLAGFGALAAAFGFPPAALAGFGGGAGLTTVAVDVALADFGVFDFSSCRSR